MTDVPLRDALDKLSDRIERIERHLALSGEPPEPPATIGAEMKAIRTQLNRIEIAVAKTRRDLALHARDQAEHERLLAHINAGKEV
jgi:hypothetical protein